MPDCLLILPLHGLRGKFFIGESAEREVQPLPCGLEGRSKRARDIGNSVASLVVLTGIERGAQPRCPFSGTRKRAKKSAGPEPIKITGFRCTFSGGKKYQKAPAPGSHKNHFQAGNFITRAGAPHSNNKISFPLGRLFVDGTKGAVQRQRQRQRHKRKRLPF